jgi:uncharacterized membrane protein YfhO
MINGEAAEIKRANYILRALDVPSGNNIIEFKFEPTSYYIGNKISFAGSLITLLAFAASIWFDFKSRSVVLEEQ